MEMTMVEKVSEAMWQAEWARAGNGGRRRVDWDEIAPDDQERYRFVALAVIEAIRPTIHALSFQVASTPYEQGWNHALGKVDAAHNRRARCRLWQRQRAASRSCRPQSG